MAPTSTERPALPANLRRTSLWAILLLSVTLLGFAFGVPASLVVLVSAPAAISFAIAALVYARGVADAVGIRIWLWVAIGVGATSFFAGLGQVLILGPLQNLEDCYAQAITPQAKRECDAEFEKSYNDLLERYGSYGTVTNQ